MSALRSIRLRSSPRPSWIVGISEGAEIVPALGDSLGADLRGLVLLAAPGLDPADTVRLQAQRLGRLDAWDDIQRNARSGQSDDAQVHGRSLGYWRDLLGWSLEKRLTETSWTVLQLWGDADELVPAAAFERFMANAGRSSMRLCSVRWPNADHGLFSSALGPAQQHAWKLLNQWASAGRLNGCEL